MGIAGWIVTVIIVLFLIIGIVSLLRLSGPLSNNQDDDKK